MKTVIEMAKEAGLPTSIDGMTISPLIERFYQLAFAAGAAHEREKQAEQDPVAWRVRGYNQFKTGNPAPWRYVDGADKPTVNKPDCCDFEPLYTAPVQQAEQEPNYFGLTHDHTWLSIDKKQYDKLKPEGRMACYAAPVRTKDLTDDELNALWHNTKGGWIGLFRAVIAADREKNR